MRVARLVTTALFAAGLLIGCEEMVDDTDEAEGEIGRCDAGRDWYIDKQITLIYLEGDMNPPRVPDPDNPGETNSDWSALRIAGERYEGQIFTLKTFDELQKALFATGYYQKDGRKWGIETVARPGLPDEGLRTPRCP